MRDPGALPFKPTQGHRVLACQKPGADATQRGARPAGDAVRRILSLGPHEGAYAEELAAFFEHALIPQMPTTVPGPRAKASYVLVRLQDQLL
jgi:hypothetical protein